jgi:hypothetical protein
MAPCSRKRGPKPRPKDTQDDVPVYLEGTMTRAREQGERRPAFVTLVPTWEGACDCLVVLGCLSCEVYLGTVHRFWQEQLFPAYPETPFITQLILGSALVWHVGFAVLTLAYLVARRLAPGRGWTKFAAVFILFLMLIFCMYVVPAALAVMPMSWWIDWS